MTLIDTHCHIHDSEFYLDSREQAYAQSRAADVVMYCVGTSVQSSREAIEFALSHAGCWAIVGTHPHEAKDGDAGQIRALIDEELRNSKLQHRNSVIIGIGEIGLDYYYENSPREAQVRLLGEQLALAQEYDLPVSFHVREAFDDFWPIFDERTGIRGVLHSFTDTEANYQQAVKRGLYIGINGISTFTKDSRQQELYRQIPLEHILLETDAPFLTPAPIRGKTNIPAYVGRVAEHQAMQKGVSPQDVARITTKNAQKVFGVR